MNLMQEESQNENKVKSLKTSLIVIVVFAVILIIVAVIIYVYSLKMATDRRKVIIDGTGNSALAKDEEAFIIEGNKVYTSVKSIASSIGYSFYPGEYQQYTEDETSCYVTNQKELVTLSAGSDSIRKYPQLSKTESQSFKLEEPVQDRANNLYISQKDMERVFNTVVEYKSENNTISLRTLPYVTSTVSAQIKESYLNKKEGESSSNEMTESIFFNNQKALLSNFVVIRDDNTKLFGVAKVEGTELETVITERYKTVEFIEGVNDFIVKTEEGKYGIIGSEGLPKVKPSYDAIQELDKDLGLYLVTSNNKQGVVNQNGNVIVYQEYDQIGLDADNGDKNVKNRYLLYNNCIPVKVNQKWGLIDKNGTKILNTEYDGIGCKLPSAQANTSGIVLIPDMEGIIIRVDINTTGSSSRISKYGVIDANGEKITDMVADSAYAITTDNKVTYCLSVDNQVVDIVGFWNQWKYGNNEQSGKTQQGEQQEETQQSVQNIIQQQQTQQEQQVQNQQPQQEQQQTQMLNEQLPQQQNQIQQQIVQ